MGKSAEPNRRDDILKAARAVFKQSGYEKAHVEEIARRAGVAKGTVYLYFPSKWAILDALCDQYQEMMAEAIEPALKNPDSFLAIKDAMHAALELASRERDLLKLLDLRLGLAGGGRAIENPRGQELMRQFMHDRLIGGDIQDYDPVIASELTSGFVQWITKVCLLWKHVDVKLYEDIAVRMLQNALLNENYFRGGKK